jgi:hypothetical protein
MQWNRCVYMSCRMCVHCGQLSGLTDRTLLRVFRILW